MMPVRIVIRGCRRLMAVLAMTNDRAASRALARESVS
jgi:hypothetical protein